MSSRTSSGLLNPKRASGDSSSSSTSTSGSSSLNPKRASGTGVLKPTASSSAATAGASILRKKSPNNSLDTAAKGVAGLKVGDSPPGGSRRLPVASTRRRGDDDTPSAAPASSSSSSSSSASSSLSAAKANQARRRLSITAGKDDASKLDGHSTDDSVKDPLTKVLKSMSAASAQPAAAAAASSAGPSATAKPKRSTHPFDHYSSLSKVGFVPFNASKVNQDRSVEIARFGNNEEKAFFGVFDGHGSLGHEVSSFLISELPKFFLRQANLDSNPHEAISKAFVDCNVKLASSAIDCTFSGSTAIVVYISNGKIYSCNAGDSRAVLARTSPNDSKSTAIALSSDQKPEREDEKKRILECKGRVEACKGMRGEDIGPPRVWLSHQDVPGLAMTRSFGDLIAASVGVIPKPEIWERDATDTDKFMVLASDGVWEFISNQEAVDIVDRHWPNTEKGAAALVEEATRRWHAEEEVVDDITCIVVAFQPA